MKKIIPKWLMGDIVEKHSTNASFDKIIETLTEVVAENNFGIVGVHDMRETYTKKNLQIADDFEYKIVQICNAPHLIKQ